MTKSNSKKWNLNNIIDNLEGYKNYMKEEDLQGAKGNNNFGKEFYLSNIFYNGRRHRKDISFDKLMGRIKKSSRLINEISKNYSNFSIEEKQGAQIELKKLNLYAARSNIHRCFINEGFIITDLILNPKTGVYEQPFSSN